MSTWVVFFRRRFCKICVRSTSSAWPARSTNITDVCEKKPPMSTYVNPSVGILNHGWGHSTDDSRMATDALHPWHMSDMLGYTRPDICRHASVTSAPDIRFSASVDFDIRFPTYVRTPTDAYGWSVNPIRGHPCSSVGIRALRSNICHGCTASVTYVTDALHP